MQCTEGEINPPTATAFNGKSYTTDATSLHNLVFHVFRGIRGDGRVQRLNGR